MKAFAFQFDVITFIMCALEYKTCAQQACFLVFYCGVNS